jgi:hypothetical protein
MMDVNRRVLSFSRHTHFLEILRVPSFLNAWRIQYAAGHLATWPITIQGGLHCKGDTLMMIMVKSPFWLVKSCEIDRHFLL